MSQDGTLTIGQKIQKYRQNAGFTQQELEIAIDTSFGTISRIEHNLTNPTKETLYRIAEALNLDELEIADLFALQNQYSLTVLNILDQLQEIQNIDDALQMVVDAITNKLDYIGSSILMIEGNNLRIKYIGVNPTIIKLTKVLQRPFTTVTSPLASLHDNNLAIAIREKRTIMSSDFFKFSDGLVSRSLGYVVIKLGGFRTGLAVPIYTDKKSFGVFYLGKHSKMDYSLEIPLLESIAKHVALKIEHSEKK